METAPNIAFVWGIWQQNISLNQLISSGYVMCWAAKWVGEDRVFFSSLQHAKPRVMLKKVHALMSMADAVITWNGQDFDGPTLNREFLKHELGPPAPYVNIDLMRVAKKRFRFLSNKLEYVVKDIKCGEKMKNEGQELWTKCLNGNIRAWATMKKYNIQDVRILEGVYNKFLPWISNHPHTGLREGDPKACPNCGSNQLIARGFGYTKLGKYQRYQCKTCGVWTRNGKRVALATHSGIAS